MFRTFVKVRHASVLADPYPLCYDSSTNTNPRLSIRCWSGGCCFISLCSAICGVSAISRKSAMSRPLVFCSSVALSSKILLTRTCLHIDCSNGSLLFHLSVAPRSGTKTTSRPLRTSTASLLKHPFMPPVANHTKSDMKCVAMMAVFSLSTMAIVLVVVLSVNRCSPKKHCRSVKSGSFSSECTQVTRLCGSLMRCPVLSSYFIILPVRTFPLISICQKIVEPPHFFEVPTLYKANSRSVSSLPKTVEMYRYKGLTE